MASNMGKVWNASQDLHRHRGTTGPAEPSKRGHVAAYGALSSKRRASPYAPHTFAQRLGTACGVGIILLFALAAAVKYL